MIKQQYSVSRRSLNPLSDFAEFVAMGIAVSTTINFAAAFVVEAGKVFQQSALPTPINPCRQTTSGCCELNNECNTLSSGSRLLLAHTPFADPPAQNVIRIPSKSHQILTNRFINSAYVYRCKASEEEIR